MIARGYSFILQGIDALLCEVEVDLSPAQLPRTTVVGLPDTAVKESLQRMRTALENSGYFYPRKRITINLAPADTPKEGPVYDLPMALSLLRASETIAPPGAASHIPRMEDYLVAGELALDGRVRPIKGAISLALLARRLGVRGVIVPAFNAAEAAAVESVEVIGVETLGQVVELFNGARSIEPHPTVCIEQLVARSDPEVDFGDVKGQEAVKRALTVAAAGAHNVVMIGPPGTGKSMLARALTGILPPLTPDEVLEVTRIYSSVGRIPRGESLVLRRPVRSPHHTASAAAIIGGGSIPRPGDVSLAHRGVLFLDEMPEFSRPVLETLRQPLEDGHVTIARAQGSARFPARFMLVAALNPSQRGDGPIGGAGRGAGDGAGDGEPGYRERDRYLSRLSRPLIDRIDIQVEVPAVPFRQLVSRERGTDTTELRERVIQARSARAGRGQGDLTNAELSGRQLDRWAPLDEAGQQMLGSAMAEMGLSARAYDRIRRVARTIADLEASERVQEHHISEAVQYRLLDRVLG